MKPDSRQWDLELIEDLFESRDVELIKQVPLSVNLESDSWFWNKDPTGFFTVKSAYTHLLSVNGSWNSSMEEDVWKMSWKIKAPPKILHFVWKALSGCLPTRTQLHSKHVPVDLHCVFCNVTEESIFHVLVQCSFAHSCWLRSALGVGHSVATNFFDWFMEVLAVGNMGLVEEAVMIGWAIWKARNDMLWNGKSCSAVDVVWMARTTLRQWTCAQSKRLDSISVTSSHTDTREHWSKPTAGQLKINVDGAVFEDTNEVGTGFVARGCDGRVIEAFSTISSVSCRPEIAEVLSVKEALSWIKRNNKSHVILETDCILVVQAILSSVSMPSIFGLFVQDCQFILSSLSNVSISHVKRSANKAAHCMARGACYWSGRCFTESDVPLALQSIILVDASV
ncbi:hypothetical protein CsatB_007813 [Cannabis sativa]